MNGSLKQALAQARQSRPEALPADFADGVMARLKAGDPVIRPRDWIGLGAAAILTAAATGLFTEPANSSPHPPPMPMFSSPAFAAR
ncbi:hypothetical protein OKA05_13955 [Luteolibacter arcticus]|uniref:Uncharacterized protein n=1 Tax=Luteolibacter arcticus TaxID=1581411 RepID=A0ABT3GJG6_9BACT|nr:hypothetical protein [Luteolibacter arcticus]MCW1923665.1 hypothetical protein [Luteolibacter arcticus]